MFDETAAEGNVYYDKYSYKQATLRYGQIHKSIFQKDLCQCAWIEIDKKYIQTYFVGPIFLPLLPVFFLNRQPKLDPLESLEIKLTAYSPQEFNDSVIDVPNLTIETSKGVFKPTIATQATGKHEKVFSYAVLVAETDWFIIHEAEISLSSGKRLKIPKTRFELKSNVEIFWNLPLAP